jgi:hypothetical protein
MRRESEPEGLWSGKTTTRQNEACFACLLDIFKAE